MVVYGFPRSLSELISYLRGRMIFLLLVIYDFSTSSRNFLGHTESIWGDFIALISGEYTNLSIKMLSNHVDNSNKIVLPIWGINNNLF